MKLLDANEDGGGTGDIMNTSFQGSISLILNYAKGMRKDLGVKLIPPNSVDQKNFKKTSP